MAMQGADERWGEIRDLHKKHLTNYQIGGGLMLVLIGVWIGSLLFAGDNGYPTNLYTELLSIGVTVFILDLRAQQREENRLKEQLIRDAGSTSNETAKNAVHQLRKRGWLVGDNGILMRQDLSFADLTAAHLIRANLAKTDLDLANLTEADLMVANLTEAILISTNLTGAHLGDANLTEARLQGANLCGANLTGANLWNATFDKKTTLPDGSKWAPDTDLTKFGAIVEPPEQA